MVERLSDDWAVCILQGLVTRGGPHAEEEIEAFVSRVVILESNPLVEAALRSVLRGVRDIELVAVARTLDEAIDQIPEAMPDVIICQMNEVPHDGLLVAQSIRERDWIVAILVLISHIDLAKLARGLQLGVRGWIHRASVEDLLPHAIRALTSDGYWIDPRTADLIFSEIVTLHTHLTELEKRLASYENPLSPQEKRVLADLGQGLSNTEIARSRYISVTTVKAHVTRILRKLRVSSREEAVERAQQLGLLILPWLLCAEQ